MKPTFILSLAAALLIVTGCQSANEAKSAATDTKTVEGTWTLVSGEAAGKPLPEQDVKNSKLTIVGDSYTVQIGDMSAKKGTQKLDSTKTPKHIDAQDTEGPTVGKNLGIYEFAADGDFRVCFAATGKERPTAFVTTPENGQFIHLWRRAK